MFNLTTHYFRSDADIVIWCQKRFWARLSACLWYCNQFIALPVWRRRLLQPRTFPKTERTRIKNWILVDEW